MGSLWQEASYPHAGNQYLKSLLEKDAMKVTLVTVDDWAGVYIDGKLHHQGHSIPDFEWMDVLRLVGVTVEEERFTEAAESAIQHGGHCPPTWPPAS